MVIDEKLLLHWWDCYSRVWYTKDEYQAFKNLIKEHGADKIFDIAVNSYIDGDASPSRVLKSLRDDSFEILLEGVKDIDEMSDSERQVYNVSRREFYDMLTSEL